MCGESFSSRTKLFTHLRTALDCASAVERSDPGGALLLAARRDRQTLAFSVGCFENAASTEALVKRVIEAAGAKCVELSRASSDAARSAWHMDSGCGESVLRQDDDCGSLGDVVTARIETAVKGEALMQRLQKEIQNIQAANLGMTVLNVRILPREAGRSMQAEALCTQRVYSYLLPLRAVVLEDSSGSVLQSAVDEARSQVLQQQKQSSKPVNDDSKPTTLVKLRLADGSKVRQILKAFKDTIRQLFILESSEDAVGDEKGRVQHFGGERLYGSQNRRRFQWHNFAAPQLEGNLSPQSKGVCCALDKVQVCDVLWIHGQIFLQLRFAGDFFLTEQVRRLVATIVCIHHGWLPMDFLSIATRDDVVVSTPVAPKNSSFLEECHFSTWTRRNGGLFDHTWLERVTLHGAALHGGVSGTGDSAWSEAAQRAAAAWREQLLQRAAGTWLAISPGIDSWLQSLEKEGAPRIRAELKRVAEVDAAVGAAWRPAMAPDTSVLSKPPEAPPSAYRDVLRLLCKIREERLWPETSEARSKVIRAGADGGLSEDGLAGGSFSIFAYGTDTSPLKSQRASKFGSDPVFVELRLAVFELERVIAPQRAPSSMAAINCNAMFAPHTDAGVGKGQSKSLIVGLGHYQGGELVVEGQVSDICYQPLAFDGWKQRHWTLPFQGQRFTIVWFSPTPRTEQQ